MIKTVLREGCTQVYLQHQKAAILLVLFLLGQGPVEQSSTNKPLAMRVVGNALAYRKKLL